MSTEPASPPVPAADWDRIDATTGLPKASVPAGTAREFLKQWAFEHKYNWPNDEPSKRTFDGKDVVGMIEQLLAEVAERRQERDALTTIIEDCEPYTTYQMYKTRCERAEDALRQIVNCPAEIDSEGRRVLRISQADWAALSASGTGRKA